MYFIIYKFSNFYFIPLYKIQKESISLNLFSKMVFYYLSKLLKKKPVTRLLWTRSRQKEWEQIFRLIQLIYKKYIHSFKLESSFLQIQMKELQLGFSMQSFTQLGLQPVIITELLTMLSSTVTIVLLSRYTCIKIIKSPLYNGLSSL